MRSSFRSVRLFLAGLVALLATLLATGSPALAGDPVPTALTITAPASVASDTSATVAGTLLDAAGKPVKAAAITVSWRPAGKSSWTGSTTVTTSKKGKWSTSLSLRYNTEFVAGYAGSTGTAPSTSPVITTMARQSVKITSVSPSRPAIGQLVTVSGTVSKALRGHKISLQRKLQGSWTTVGSAKATDTGTYAVTLRVSDASTLLLRARSGKNAKISRGTSKSRTVNVAVTATLYTGGKLGARRVLTSPDGSYTATMGTDGNLVVRHWGVMTWSSATKGKGNAVRISDAGNLTIGKAGKPVWSSDTTGKVARLVLQNDGNLVLWSKARTLWSSAQGKGVQVAPALCWSTSFDCVSWTGYNPNISYWRMYAGHNCTNYAAYRMTLKGLSNPPWGYPGGSAWQWRAGAKKSKITVDKTPAVGAIMQWGRNTNGGGSSGHVTYVEQVTATAVTISEDSWSSHAAVRVINRSSNSFKDARFIHLADGA